MNRYPKASYKPGKMNKTEEAFSKVLDKWLAAGMITRWDFEPEKFRLADNTFYTPDFRVIMDDMRVIFYEVKGFWRDDARVKIKVCADLHPYPFRSVKMIKGRHEIEKIGIL